MSKRVNSTAEPTLTPRAAQWIRRKVLVITPAPLHGSQATMVCRLCPYGGGTVRGVLDSQASGRSVPKVVHSIPGEAEFTSHLRVGPVLDWDDYEALWASWLPVTGGSAVSPPMCPGVSTRTRACARCTTPRMGSP